MRKKEHSNQSSKNKIKLIYQEIHEKRNITNILTLSVEYSSVCACIYVCTNMDIKKKRLNIESVLLTIKCMWTKYFV